MLDGPTMSLAKPVVLVPACNRMLGEHPFHVAGRKYLDAVRLAGALPLVVTSADVDEFEQLLDLADGVLLTGSPSNVQPSHYGQPVRDATLPQDPQRDAWTLAIIPRVLERGIPLMAICRGAQEVNVALGGTLHQAVQEVDPYDDHRADDRAPAELQYGLAHDVHAVPGGLVARIVGQTRFRVNSIHGQAVDRLAARLQPLAHAPDGLVEAFHDPAARGFNLCVQWHPEWRACDNPVSVRLFQAFGQALREHQSSHHAARKTVQAIPS